MQLVKNKKLKYSLDCMFVDERRLYSTWLCVPVLRTHVDVVDVNFRFVRGGWRLESERNSTGAAGLRVGKLNEI